MEGEYIKIEKNIIIEVEGGLVQDVKGLPNGYTYEINDKDILEDVD